MTVLVAATTVAALPSYYPNLPPPHPPFSYEIESSVESFSPEPEQSTAAGNLQSERFVVPDTHELKLSAVPEPANMLVNYPGISTPRPPFTHELQLPVGKSDPTLELLVSSVTLNSEPSAVPETSETELPVDPVTAKILTYYPKIFPPHPPFYFEPQSTVQPVLGSHKSELPIVPGNLELKLSAFPMTSKILTYYPKMLPPHPPFSYESELSIESANAEPELSTAPDTPELEPPAASETAIHYPRILPPHPPFTYEPELTVVPTTHNSELPHVPETTENLTHYPKQLPPLPSFTHGFESLIEASLFETESTTTSENTGLDLPALTEIPEPESLAETHEIEIPPAPESLQHPPGYSRISPPLPLFSHEIQSSELESAGIQETPELPVDLISPVLPVSSNPPEPELSVAEAYDDPSRYPRIAIPLPSFHHELPSQTLPENTEIPASKHVPSPINVINLEPPTYFDAIPGAQHIPSSATISNREL